MALSHSPSIATDGLVLCVDPANKKSYSQNEFQYSTDLFAFYGPISVNSGTVSRDTISSPVGTTPMRMAVTGNDPHTGSYNILAANIAPAASGQRWLVSVYAKASQNTTGEIVMFGATSAGTAFVGGGWLNIASSPLSITTEWQRFSAIIDFTNASVERIQVRFDGPESGGAGINIWWDGLQVERVPAGTTTPTQFTSLYYGGSVYKDLSGNSRNATFANYPLYSSDGAGTILINSTGPYVDLNINNYGITDAYTVSFWVKRIGGTGVFLYIGQSNTTGMYFESYFDADLVTWFFGPNSPQQIPWGNGTLSTTSWTHVTMTMVTSTKTQTRYFNGVKSGSSTILPNTVNAPSGSNTWRIKNNFQSWTGYIGNLMIYNRALTDAEVQQNFNALRGRYGI